jgi:four helix bundle protein
MIYDLEERTQLFSRNVITLCKGIRQDAISKPIISQVVRSSGSIAANYIEANEKLSPKDFLMRMRISRKEAKETVFWLNNLNEISPSQEIGTLLDEARQLNKILSTIIYKTEHKQ